MGKIPPLDGIRALGIALVLFFHGGFAWASGGFFGVDVFFVLSGFLITGLLISEFRQNLHIGLRRFWGHRVRRLLPALLAMLAGVALYGVFLAPPDTLGQLRGDAVATLLYGNNWHLMTGPTGYFADLNTPRPLLPTWSLSIEEQFYVVWPLVVLAVLAWTRSLRTLLVVTVTGAVASAVAMSVLYHGGSGENRVYYGTDTRAQALLIGAALAIVLARPLRGGGTGGRPRERTAPSLVIELGAGRVGRWALTAVGGLGLATVAWMSVTSSGSTTWIYHGGFALVAVATAAVIACVALVPTSPWARVLSLRPVRYVGAISYGLYLWHWPIFLVVDNARTGLVGWPLFLVRVAIAVGVASLSYHVLEMPIRRGVLRGWRGWTAVPLAIGTTAVVMVAATAGATPALSASVGSLATDGHSGSAATPAQVAGDPATDASAPSVPSGVGGPIRVLLVGDSEASFLSFGLGPLSAAYGVDFANDGVFGCGLLQGETMFHGTLVSQVDGEREGRIEVPCASQLVRWRADLQAFHPDVVLLEDGEYEVRNQLLHGKWTHIGEPAFDAAELGAIRSAVSTLRSTGATVVLLTAPYYHQPEQADGEPWPEDNPARVDIYNRLLREVASQSGGDVVVANLNARLDPGGKYAQTINGVDVRFADGIHIDVAGAKMVAPWLLTRAAALGTANRASRLARADGHPAAPDKVTGATAAA